MREIASPLTYKRCFIAHFSQDTKTTSSAPIRVEIVGHIVYCDLKRNGIHLKVDDGTGMVNVIRWMPIDKEAMIGPKELSLGDVYMIRGHVVFYREEIQVNVEDMVELTLEKYFYWIAESEYNHFSRQPFTNPQLPKGQQ